LKIKGITHAEILDQIKRTIEIDRKKAIQITERDCIVTVDDNHTNIKLLVEGVEVQNQHLKCMDVEKEITNITIKNTPVELGGSCFCHIYMMDGLCDCNVCMPFDYYQQTVAR
jgi:translation elongation factor EF-4